MNDRAAQIERARAIWARTGSDSAAEAATARRALDRYLRRTQLSMADLGERPYKDAVPAPAQASRSGPYAQPRPPQRPQQPQPPQWHRTATPPQTGSSNNATFTFYANSIHFDMPGFRTTIHFEVPNGPLSDAQTGPTWEPAPPLLRAALEDAAAHYDMHWFKDWGMFACVGRRRHEAHTFVAMYGSKWDAQFGQHRFATPSTAHIATVWSALRRTQFAVRTEPYAGVTEDDHDREQDWIELIDFNCLHDMQAGAIVAFLQGAIQAARQYETKYHL